MLCVCVHVVARMCVLLIKVLIRATRWRGVKCMCVCTVVLLLALLVHAPVRDAGRFARAILVAVFWERLPVQLIVFVSERRGWPLRR